MFASHFLSTSSTAYKSDALRIWWITAYFSENASSSARGLEDEVEGASCVATCACGGNGPDCGKGADVKVGDPEGEEYAVDEVEVDASERSLE